MLLAAEGRDLRDTVAVGRVDVGGPLVERRGNGLEVRRSGAYRSMLTTTGRYKKL